MADLISREAAKEAMYYEAHSRPALDAIIKLPAVDAIPVEWLRQQYHQHIQDNDRLMCDAYAVVLGEWYEWQKERKAQDAKM